MSSVRTLKEQAVAAIRAGSRTDDDGERTRQYRAAAEALVDARPFFTGTDGLPDWGGRSHDYRVWVGECYGEAGVLPAERHRVQGAIRYHVGNLLREKAPKEALEALGMATTTTPIERGAKQRAARSEIVRAVRGQAEVDTLRAMTAAEALLKRIGSDDVQDLAGERLDAAREALAGIRREVNRLARVTK